MRGGYYRVFNIIWFDTRPGVTWTPDGYRTLAAHELGHVYGLDEKYNEGDLSCNYNLQSIMNSSYTTGGSCNGGFVSPTCCAVGTDKWRASDFYYLRPAVNLTSSSSASTMTGTWLDHNWTESKYRVYLEYCTTSPTGACSYFSAWDHYQPGFLGQGDPYQSNVSMQVSWTRFIGEPRGYYRFCIATYSPVRGQQYYVCAPKRAVS